MLNDQFMNAMHKINEKAKVRGYTNGLAWAKASAEIGEISQEALSGFESCHPLRNLIAHGGAGEISVSEERYNFVLSILDKIEKSNVNAWGVSYDGAPSEQATPEQIEAWQLKGKEHYDKEEYEEAVKSYSKAAVHGNARAQNHLANCYLMGRGVAKDEAKAVELYRKAVAQGEKGAQANLGRCYLYGTGVQKDWAMAVSLLEKAAEQGVTNAQWRLAECYRWGKGVKKDGKAALKWYQKAVDSDYALAMGGIGDCYYNGIGVNKDYAKAFEWYKKGVDKNDAHSMYGLGNCYKHANGVKYDGAAAAKYYDLAATNGDMFAMISLAECFEEGVGLPQNSNVGRTWFSRGLGMMQDALKNGSAEEYYEYSNFIHRKASNGDRWLITAAEMGHVDAMIRLGNRCMDASQAEGSLEEKKARELFLKAIDAGSVEAMYWMGQSYERVYPGSYPDDEHRDKAYKWKIRASMFGHFSFGGNNSLVLYMENHMKSDMIDELSEASKQGYPIASRLLSICYQYGYVVEQNKSEKIRYLHLAADQGDSSAQRIIAMSILESENKTAKDKEKAWELLLKAAECGDTIARFKLARRYSNGDGVAKDMGKAFYWYQKAVEDSSYIIDATENGEFKRLQYEAYYELVICYENGIGTEKDLRRALGCYLFAFNAELPKEVMAELHYKYGRYHYTGVVYGRPSYHEALREYKIAAELGHKKAKKEIFGTCIKKLFS